MGNRNIFPTKASQGSATAATASRQAGGQPACVAGCPNRALDFGDMNELKQKYGADLDNGSITVLPSPDQTHPNILIKTKDCAFDEGYQELNW